MTVPPSELEELKETALAAAKAAGQYLVDFSRALLGPPKIKVFSER